MFFHFLFLRRAVNIVLLYIIAPFRAENEVTPEMCTFIYRRATCRVYVFREKKKKLQSETSRIFTVYSKDILCSSKLSLASDIIYIYIYCFLNSQLYRYHCRTKYKEVFCKTQRSNIIPTQKCKNKTRSCSKSAFIENVQKSNRNCLSIYLYCSCIVFYNSLSTTIYIPNIIYFFFFVIRILWQLFCSIEFTLTIFKI